MKAIKITFISALTKVNAYKLKCGVRKGVMYRQYTYIYIQLSAGYTRLAKRDCGVGVGVGVDVDVAVDNLFCNFLAGNNESLFLATGKKSAVLF